MPAKTKINSRAAKRVNRCPIVAKPRLRLASDRQTDSIKDNFPAGLAKPALRALYAAGLTRLDQLTRVRETDLAALHGVGPKAIRLLQVALNAQRLGFRD